jgi:hypothetical protein
MTKEIVSFKYFCPFLVLFLFNFLLAASALAGSPFLTDDPETLDYKHQEIYLFSTIDKTNDSNTIQGPAVEYNYGVLPNLQLHVITLLEYFSPPQDDLSHYGIGDMEIGAKYRFFAETNYLPQIGIYPAIELPTGDTDRGLGSGRSWYKLPIWLQKSWGEWTVDGGGGYALNDSPGTRNYGFGGLLVQREFGEHLSLGGEVFAQEASTVDERGFTLFNLGGTYNFTSDFSLLFSIGHSFTGQRNAVAYLGLYWTWGPKEKVSTE